MNLLLLKDKGLGQFSDYPNFLTIVLDFMSIPTTFNESVMILEYYRPVPAIRKSVFSSLSLNQFLDSQVLISNLLKGLVLHTVF